MQFLLKNLHMALLRLTPTGLQHQGSGLKGSMAYREELKCLASRQELGKNFPSDKRQARSLLLF